MKFSIFLPGPLSLGYSYKAISTLDSMIGYKYDQYKYLGFFSAKIEDYSTFLPSRLVLLTSVSYTHLTLPTIYSV